MLACPQHHHSAHLFHHPLRRLPPSATAFFTTNITASSSSEQKPAQITAPSSPLLLKTHNAKSTSYLLRNLSPNLKTPARDSENDADVLAHEKVKLIELSLATKRRTPTFPGAVSTSLPPLNTLLVSNDDEEEEDDEAILRAIEIRRKVTREIFKDEMRRGKFGITYTENVVAGIDEFIDYVMIEAAKMKGEEEFLNLSFNARARRVIEDSGAVPLIRWLKHNALSYPQICKILCMAKRDLESVRRYVEWLKNIHVKGRYIGIALMRAGHAMMNNGIEGLDEIFAYLESNGVRRDWMGYVMGRCPKLLCYSMEELKSRVSFYTSMGMDEKDFGTMVYDYPRVLGGFTMEEMNGKVSYLKEFGLSNEDVGRLFAFKPELMACSIEERWKPLVKYLYYLGISRDGMKRMLIIKPMVFCIDLESCIVPKVQFLQDLGIRNEAIGNMLVKFPPLLTYSLYKKIRPVVIFLMSRAGVSQQNIAKVIASGPELLGCSIANKLEINLKYLLSLGIPLRNVGEMIADFPMLLRYSLDPLRPKYSYLRRTMVRPLQDLIEFPRFFSYSLEERIIPRHQVMVANRVNFKLRYMLASTDEEFNLRVAAAVERRQRFESRTTNELSDSQTYTGSTSEAALAQYFEGENSASNSSDGSIGRSQLESVRCGNAERPMLQTTEYDSVSF